MRANVCKPADNVIRFSISNWKNVFAISAQREIATLFFCDAVKRKLGLVNFSPVKIILHIIIIIAQATHSMSQLAYLLV